MNLKRVFAIVAAVALFAAIPAAAQTISGPNLIHLSGTTIVPNSSAWSFQGAGGGGTGGSQPFLIGNAASALPQTIAQFSTSTLNSFAQMVLWNTNSGNNASSDFVFNDASSTQTSYFGEFGEDGANYSQSAFSGESPHDLFVMSSDANVDIEAASTTTGGINFLTGGTQSANLRMTINDIGKVGIGTASPQFLLDMESSVAGSVNSILRVANTSTSASSPVGLVFTTDEGDGFRGRSEIISGLDVANSGYLAFQTRNTGTLTEKMRITGTGNVGVATTTPVANFQATTASANATTTIELGKSAQTKGTCIKLYRADGSAIYAFIATGATAFTLTTTACASVTGF